MGEEQVFTLNSNSWGIARILPFPDGKHLLALAGSGISLLDASQGFVVDLEKKSAEELGETPVTPGDMAWQEPGKSILFSRTVNGLTNIWKMDLTDKSLAQVTFGPGPDRSPMPALAGKGLYIVNGKSTGYLTAYNTRTKQSVDIAAENATQPVISRNGKRLMYVTYPSRDRTDLWVADMDGNNKNRISRGVSIGTGFWSPDDSRLAFFAEEPGKETKLYLSNPDGSGLQTLNWINAATVQAVEWSADQKSVFINGWQKGAKSGSIWRESVEGSEPEMLTEECGFAFEASPDGKYLLSLIAGGDKFGIYSFSLADRKCTPLVPGIVTFGLTIEKDGKSFLYALPGKKEVTIYRQKWEAGKAVGAPQVALVLPFAFPLVAGGNAYDFSRDLTTVVYARPSGHADLYLLTQQ